jgi:hypothetical protein
MTEANPDPAERKREYNRRYWAANRERLRQQKRQYYAANRETVLERVKQYQEANRSAVAERKRAARAADPEKRRRQNRDYRQANLEKLREAYRRYYETNGEAIREKGRRYYLATRAQQREYRLNWAHGIDAASWAAKWDEQQGRCYLCRRDMDPAEAFVEHWHGCPGHEPQKSCRYCQRGLAHQNCNFAVAYAADDPSLLRIIADNLERANADVAARQAVMPQHTTLF